MLSQQLEVQQAVEYVEPRDVPGHWHVLKRLTDVVVSSAALVISAPILAAASIGIVMVSPGSPFFVQERVGKDGRIFRLIKLRSMISGAHLMHEEMRRFNEVSGPVLKIRRDPRLHGFGAFLRKTSIDELPNFINVLFGDLSVVGPRPPLPVEVKNYDAWARRRLAVKPGITCLWQISGRSDVDFDRWMDLDNEYIDSWTPRLDCEIILKTIPAVLLRRGAL